MPTIIEEIKLVFADVTDNHNKVWYGYLYDDNSVETKWGRIGYDLQSKLFPNAGKNFLDKKYSEKIKKGYTELKTIASTPGNTSVTVPKSNLHEIAKSQIIKSSNPILNKLIDRLVASNVHKITSNTQITYNSTTGLFATPLGIVEMSGLIEARNLLAELAPLINIQDFGRAADSILSKYLRIIPQNIGMKKFNTQTLIPDNDALQKQLDLIDSLESSYQALQTTPAVKSPDGTPSLEQVFKVDMNILSDDRERRRISSWYENSKKDMHHYGSVKIREIFIVNIHEMTNGFENSTSPMREVWHGTSQANCLSILKSGLKTSPPSTAAIAGKMFGNGIYGATNSSKSLGYTLGRWGQGGVGDAGWLFVCDFAMGKTYITHSGCNKPHGYDSVWAKAGSNLYNDELIVYRNSQVKVKYLLECK